MEVLEGEFESSFPGSSLVGLLLPEGLMSLQLCCLRGTTHFLHDLLVPAVQLFGHAWLFPPMYC